MTDRDRAAEPAAEGHGEDTPVVPVHPALVPRGEAVAWSALGSLLAGPVVWGGVGYLVDRLLGTAPLGLAIGAVVGSLAGFWIVYLRFGRDDGGNHGAGPRAT